MSPQEASTGCLACAVSKTKYPTLAKADDAAQSCLAAQAWARSYAAKATDQGPGLISQGV